MDHKYYLYLLRIWINRVLNINRIQIQEKSINSDKNMHSYVTTQKIKCLFSHDST